MFSTSDTRLHTCAAFIPSLCRHRDRTSRETSIPAPRPQNGLTGIIFPSTEIKSLGSSRKDDDQNLDPNDEKESVQDQDTPEQEQQQGDQRKEDQDGVHTSLDGGAKRRFRFWRRNGKDLVADSYESADRIPAQTPSDTGEPTPVTLGDLDGFDAKDSTHYNHTRTHSNTTTDVRDESDVLRSDSDVVLDRGNSKNNNNNNSSTEISSATSSHRDNNAQPESGTERIKPVSPNGLQDGNHDQDGGKDETPNGIQRSKGATVLDAESFSITKTSVDPTLSSGSDFGSNDSVPNPVGNEEEKPLNGDPALKQDDPVSNAPPTKTKKLGLLGRIRRGKPGFDAYLDEASEKGGNIAIDDDLANEIANSIGVDANDQDSDRSPLDQDTAATSSLSSSSTEFAAGRQESATSDVGSTNDMDDRSRSSQPHRRRLLFWGGSKQKKKKKKQTMDQLPNKDVATSLSSSLPTKNKATTPKAIEPTVVNVVAGDDAPIEKNKRKRVANQNRDKNKDKNKKSLSRRLLVPTCFAFFLFFTSGLPWDDYVDEVAVIGSGLVANGKKRLAHALLASVDSSSTDEQASSEDGQQQLLQQSSAERAAYSSLDRRQEVLAYVKEAVQKVGPSVIRIDTVSQVQQEGSGGWTVSPPPGWIKEGQGSGLIFSSSGLVVTNAHVVEDASKVTVTLTDGRVMQAQVLGADEIVDIAVLQILPGSDGGDDGVVADMPAADFGDSDELDVGQMVIAVGSPGGLDNTVTMGIVSGLERSSVVVGVPMKKVDYIQTDAAINPGNSGGPLVDVETGEVVGINACIRANMEGTSFAIPINRVRAILDDLSEGKDVNHGYIGIAMATCTPDWAREYNERIETTGPESFGGGGSRTGPDTFPEVHGAIVSSVFPDSPADYGGLRVNDVITNIGGKPVRTTDDARRLVDSAPIGKVSDERRSTFWQRHAIPDVNHWMFEERVCVFTIGPFQMVSASLCLPVSLSLSLLCLSLLLCQCTLYQSASSIV